MTSQEGNQQSEEGSEPEELDGDAGAQETAPEPADELRAGASAAGASGIDVRDALDEIRALLRRTGRRDGRRALLEGALWYAAALGAVVLTTMLLGFVVPASVPGWAAWIGVAGVVATLLAAVATAIRFVRDAPEPEAIARRLQRIDRSFRNDLVAALEFGEVLVEKPSVSDEQLGFSRSLARAHLQRTLEGLRDRADERSDLIHLLPTRNFEPPLLALAGCLTLLLAVGFVAPDRAVHIVTAPFFGASTADRGDEIVRPIVGDIRLTYAPPRYTGKGRRSEAHSTGDIETVVGTEVTLSTYPLREFAEIEMVLKTGGDERVISLDPDRSGRLRTSFVLTDAGSYYFRGKLPDGTTVRDGMKRQIELVPDEAPKVSITSHDGKVEVSTEDVLEIEYHVEDDYGIDSIERVFRFVGADNEKSRPLDVASLSETPGTVDGSFKFDLRPLSLKPKDSVVLYLRATDNNSMTGPGTGTSDVVRLHVTSPEDKHLEIIREQRRISERLLSVLADYLENPIGTREPSDDGSYRQEIGEETSPETLADRVQTLAEIRRKQAEVLEAMKKLVGRMQEDPLMRQRNLTLFEGLHDQLRDLHEQGGGILASYRRDGDLPERLSPGRARRAARHATDVESDLEKGILRLLELVASQKMDAVQATRKDIEKLKDRLERLLKRYKKSKDPELKKAIKREIHRLRQRMAEMMRRMQMQIQKLPREHVNEEALRRAKLESGTKKMSDNLKSLEQKLEQGDIDGALSALENMDQNMASLSKEMDQQFSAAQPKGLSKLDKEMSKMMDKVNDLRSAEKKLEEDTREFQRQRQRERDKKIQEMLEEFSERMAEKVDRQLRSVDDLAKNGLATPEQASLEEARKSLNRLKKRVEQQDVQQSLEAARDSLEDLRTMRFNLNLARRHAGRNSSRANSVDRAAEKVEDEMIPRGQQIRDELKKMMERASRRLEKSGSRRPKKLAERQRKISEQAEDLEKQIDEASKEFPMLERKLKPNLKSAKDQMGKAQKRLSKGEGQGALDSERSALEQLGKLKKSMRQSIRRQRQKGKGGAGMRRDEVEIPGEKQGASREALRSEVMEAMKEDKIEKYQKEIERYYKSLVE